MLSEMGELLFSVLVSYMGGLEFYFVMKHLVHWLFQHNKRMAMLGTSGESLKELQERIKREIEEARDKELYGLKAMKDGVLYQDGFRVDPEELALDQNEVSNVSTVESNSKKSPDRDDPGAGQAGQFQNISNSEASKDQKLERHIIGSSIDNLTDTNGNYPEATPDHNLNGASEKEHLIEAHEEPFVQQTLSQETAYRDETQSVDASITPDNSESDRPTLTQSIKTQIGQALNDELIATPDRRNLALGKSDDSSSNEPFSSQKSSSLSTQPSSSLDTSLSMPEIHFDEYERQAPDGEDVNQQPIYSDDYLRSLDGIKHRPLVRDDGTGRRRAFKKRRSSGDSTSSRESRLSREEELKMFTSLEEEELESLQKGDNDYVPIRYSSDPSLKVTKHHRRHKKSPVKETRKSEDREEIKGSLEMLGEEQIDPWGEIKPEHYKDTEFWKREKAISIEEEDTDYRDIDLSEETSSGLGGTRNIPKMSSFEEASDSQHEAALGLLQKQGSREAEPEKTDDRFADAEAFGSGENVSKDEQHGNDNDANPSLAGTHFASSADEQKSLETEKLFQDLLACDQDNQIYTDHFRRRRSPAMMGDDNAENEIDETHQIQTPAIEIDSAADNGSDSGSGFEIIGAELQNPPGILEGLSDFYDFNASVNPSRGSSVDRRKSKSPSTVPRASSKEPYQFIQKSNSPQRDEKLQSRNENKVVDMQGLSDFYDFSVKLTEAAYNSNVRRDSQISVDSLGRSDDPQIKQSLDNQSNNKSKATASKNEVGPRLSEGVKGNNKKSRDSSPNFSHIPSIKITSQLSTESSMESAEHNSADPSKNAYTESIQNSSTDPSIEPIPGPSKQTPENPSEPATPQFERSFSERMKDEYRSNAFKRSTYVGESMDVLDGYEGFREEARNFQRSRSRSRSFSEADSKNAKHMTETRRQLQEKILDEITRTTINYQDFSMSLSHTFLEHERRISDSALIGKPEILIQFEEERKADDDNYDDDLMSDLEAEEYHHFRRFSLHQEYRPEEEYPDDDYVYVEQIQVISAKEAQGESQSENTGAAAEISSMSVEIDEHIEDDDADTGSEDERQTVVEVEDEIDEDIWDYDHPETENEQSECEEADRQRYEAENVDYAEWNEDGAVGGRISRERSDNHENSVEIQEMYDDAVKNAEESGIQKDYDTILRAMDDDDDQSKNRYSSGDIDDASSVRTEDLLDEILREEAEKYGYGRRGSSGSRQSSSTFLDSERDSYLQTSNTRATRLRSRYGVGTSTSYVNYDAVDSVYSPSSEPPVKPKKEYNWRKNFKLDDDDPPPTTRSSRRLSFDVDNDPAEDKETLSGNFLDVRKFSLGGESITLYSRTPDRFQDFENITYDENMESAGNSDLQSIAEDTQSFKENVNDDGENPTDIPAEEKASSKIEENQETLPDVEKPAYTTEETPATKSKKKKSKKKSRRGSKGSLENNSENNSRRNSLDNDAKLEDIENSGAKKKSKKKRKEKSPTSPTGSQKSRPLVEKQKTPEPEINSRITQKLSPDPIVIKQKTPEPKINIIEPSKSTPTPTATKQNTSEVKAEETSSKGPMTEPSGTSTQKAKPPLERTESTGVYELIKDGSMYPWF